MSAFQMDPDRIATIADAITTQYNSGYNFTRMSFGELSSQDAFFTACNEYSADPDQNRRGAIMQEHLYKALWALNRSAINERYPDNDDSEEIPPMPEKYSKIVRHLNNDNQHLAIPDDYYQLLKWVECFLYQCSEGDIPSRPLFQAVTDYCTQLRSMICCNHPAYVNALWG